MKRLLLSSVAFSTCWLASGAADAQCIGAGSVLNVPQPGISCLSEPIVPTYAATGIGIVPGTTATDIACLTGSATRVVRPQQVRVSGSGTAVSLPVSLNKHVLANTGGTAATGAALPVPYTMDSTNPAVSATTQAWTTAPTINDTTPGIISVGEIGLVATTVGASVMPYLLFDLIERNFAQTAVLRGTAQQLCVNLQSTTTTSSLNVSFWWTELAQ